ncbi:hypothetical protein [Natronobiforma cellulositropha]|uniref:hypothetical protein n=1 Tax=Natronobiforma cellulositropha TaxID=1679076 RepID=UPI0021D570BB|nr:hypothetical protein [Natronobiforma cellulositropha]
MQFRAGILYVVLFVVVAAGAYGVIATAESPEVTLSEAEATFALGEGDEFEVGGQVFNVSQLADGSGTVEHVDEEAVLDVEWDDGDSVPVEEDLEYILEINQPEVADDEDEDDASPESFTLREDYDDEEYETVERADGLYVVVTENGSEELIHIDDFDEIDSQVYEVGDAIEFYDEETETQVEGEVATIRAEVVVVEYVGELVTEFDLEHANTVTLEGEEFGVVFPGDGTVYLTDDLESFEGQLDDIETFEDRVQGLWWVVSLAGLTGTLIAGLAFMPARG